VFDQKGQMGHVAAPDTSVPTPEQTLGRWVGFRADTPEGRFGIVVGELRHGQCGRPASVVVRRGLFCERQTIVPLTAIERVLPQEQRILLRADFPADTVDERLCRPTERPPALSGGRT
jgi:hypothetical protein